MTEYVNVRVDDEPFDSQCPDGHMVTIQLPWWNPDMAAHFWSAVNEPTYIGSAEKAAALVRYVWERAYYDGRQAGVRSILGRDS